jgi:hypothetical protein
MSNLVDYLEEVSMRRKFFTAFAGVVSFLMIGAMTADAADITFGGRIRPRYEYWNTQTQDTGYIDMLTRLDAKAKISDNASAFIQLQANSRWGSATGPAFALPGVTQNATRSSNALSGNDTTTDVGIHQAYFTLNKFFGAPVDLQVGRQEIILDGHRLFGNTVWTQGMMSHDAVVLNHSHGSHTLKYIYSANVEQSSRGGAGGAFVGSSTDDVDDTSTHALWANFKGLIGENSSTSAYLVYIDTDCNSPAALSQCASGAAAGSGDFYTIGARQAGGFGDFSYRGEFYYQTGKSGAVVPVTGGTGDLDAFMFGLRAGYQAKNVAMKPGVTLWFDYLSGSSAGDLAVGDRGTFNTLFDTGHKYYGLQDFFIQTSLVGGSGTHPIGGLIDYAVKLSVQPMAKTTLKVDYHLFQVVEDDVCGTCARFGGTDTSSTLGNEVDITLVHKYSPSTKIMVGYSHMFANELLSNFNGGARVQNFEDADWLYVMFDVMF